MNLEAVITRKFPPVVQSYTARDSMIYALGLGYGADPLDPYELQYVYERNQKVVPSQCVILGYPSFWMQEPEYGIDWVHLLHAEHRFDIHLPLNPAGTVKAEYRIIAVEDKGAGKGALLYIEKKLFEECGALVATIVQSLFLRGDGGCGSFGTPPPPVPSLPQRSADLVVTLTMSQRQALIYRLSGDYNPLHADPEIASSAGFAKPILHGLCSLGMATRVLIEHFGGGEPETLRSLFVRFSKPVFPGETIRYRFFQEGQRILFLAEAPDRDVIVLDRCEAVMN